MLAACADAPTAPPSTGLPPAGRPVLSPTYLPSGRAARGDVLVHLFEWRWNDIATECEQVLGPAGVHAVQVSPPQEHSRTPNGDWSQRYQPVSYALTRSRSGTEAEFVAMVTRCKAAGVQIIVDAVLNHMTNFPSPGVGSAGTSYTKYSYPGLWTPADFHPTCALTNYQSAANVQECELYSLPDLHTGLPHVRQRLADYLVALVRLGVGGFRIDAAKHIQETELDDILGRANRALQAEGRALPTVFLEVAGGSGEALAPRDYFGIGHASGGTSEITEFIFTGVANEFLGRNGETVAQLDPNGSAGNRFSAEAWGMMPGDKAVIFLQNHDTQRTCGIGYKDGDTFRLANVWMLAQPYGLPAIHSGYAFACPSGISAGPPADGDGWTTPVQCVMPMEAALPGQWTCEHRDPAILAMVRFRSLVAGTPVLDFTAVAPQAIAFSRGTQGAVLLNNDSTPRTFSVPTRLAAGTYCDRLTGGRTGGSCAGRSVEVVNGMAMVTLPAKTALVADVTTRLP